MKIPMVGDKVSTTHKSLANNVDSRTGLVTPQDSSHEKSIYVNTRKASFIDRLWLGRIEDDATTSFEVLVAKKDAVTPPWA